MKQNFTEQNFIKQNFTKQRSCNFKKIIFTAIAGFVILIMCIKPAMAYAASASLWFEQPDGTAYAGDEVKVQLCISTDSVLGNFEGYITYDADILEYLSGPACITGGDGRLKIEDLNASASEKTRYYVMTFYAIKKGNCIFEMDSGYIAYEYETENPMSISGQAGSVIVDADFKDSDNANLSLLKINPGDVTPSFNKDIYEYSTIVDSSTDKLIISAIAQEAGAKVAVDGNNNFVTGINIVTITVTAPSGNTAEYIISVIKEAETGNEQKPTPTPLPKADETTIRFNAVQNDDITFLSGNYTYKVIDNAGGVSIPKGYSKTQLLIDGITIAAYSNESEDASNEFVLLVLENEAGENNLYRYDRIEKTIQRYVQEKGISDNSPNTIKQQEFYQDALDLKKYESQIDSLKLILSISIGIAVLLVTAIIYLLVKVRGINDDID